MATWRERVAELRGDIGLLIETLEKEAPKKKDKVATYNSVVIDELKSILQDDLERGGGLP